MNAFRSRAIFGFVLVCSTALPSRAATPVIGAQLFQDTNVRIDDLFQYRKNPPKAPGVLDNPFRPIDAAIPPPVSDNPEDSTNPEVRESIDESMLRTAYGRLTFGGLIQVGDSLRVVINKVPYREGGILVLKGQGPDIYLRIIKLSRDSITLGLNDARLSLTF